MIQNKRDVWPWVGLNNSNGKELVDIALVPTEMVMLDRVAIETRPMRLGKQIDIIELSRNPLLLTAKGQSRRDVLDVDIAIDSLYIRVSGVSDDKPVDDVYCIPGTRLTKSVFRPIIADSPNRLNIDTDGSILELNEKTHICNGNGFSKAILKDIQSSDPEWYATVSLRLIGDVDINSGEIYLAVDSLSFDYPGCKSLPFDIFTAEVIGYHVNAQRMPVTTG